MFAVGVPPNTIVQFSVQFSFFTSGVHLPQFYKATRGHVTFNDQALGTSCTRYERERERQSLSYMFVLNIRPLDSKSSVLDIVRRHCFNH